MEAKELSEVKQRARATWSEGDYDFMARLIASAGEAAVRAADLGDGDQVLDIACGTGNATLPAARAGAEATGLDLTPKLLEEAKAAAGEAGLEIDWLEGDAEELPFEDGSFDAVISVFGIMFAPDQRLAAREAARVVAPGGRLALCNWTPEGATGQFFALIASHLPPPPEGFQPPVLWGDEDHVRSVFDGTGVELAFERAAVDFEFESVDAAMRMFETKFGPILMAKAALEPEGKWEAARGDIRASFSEDEQEDGSVRYPAEYLIAKGTKR